MPGGASLTRLRFTVQAVANSRWCARRPVARRPTAQPALCDRGGGTVNGAASLRGNFQQSATETRGGACPSGIRRAAGDLFSSARIRRQLVTVKLRQRQTPEQFILLRRARSASARQRIVKTGAEARGSRYPAPFSPAPVNVAISALAAGVARWRQSGHPPVPVALPHRYS